MTFNALKLLASSIAVAALATACAADDEPQTETSEGASTVGACQPDATFIAYANRVCSQQGKTAQLGSADRTYYDHGEAKSCPGGEAVSIPFSCN